MTLTAAQVEKHRARAVSEDELEEHKWEVALHNERAVLEARKGTPREGAADGRRLDEIGEALGEALGERKKAKPRTATRGDDAETREAE